MADQTSCVCRPGEMRITDRMAQLCGWNLGDRILDLGCGTGASLDYLKEKYGISGIGLERNEAFCDGIRILHGDAAELPFDAISMDGVLMECSLSRMEEPEKVLGECFRVLKTGGYLAVSDMIAEGEEVREIRHDGPPAALGRLESETRITKRFQQAGFELIRIENCHEDLKQWFGQLLMDHGRAGLGQVMGLPWDRIKQACCSYRLWICRKPL